MSYATDNIKYFSVAGVSFKQNELKSLCNKNNEFEYSKEKFIENFEEDEKVYEYTYYNKCILEPEPDNQYDPNAIKVITNGVHIGYIKTSDFIKINEILNQSDKIIAMNVTINGGKCKYWHDDNEDEIVILPEINLFAEICIILKSEKLNTSNLHITNTTVPIKSSTPIVNNVNIEQPKRKSALSIVAFVLSLTFYLSFIGAGLGALEIFILDKDKKNNQIFSQLALIIGGGITILVILGIIISNFI